MSSQDHKWAEDIADRLIRKYGTKSKAKHDLVLVLTTSKDEFYKQGVIRVDKSNYPSIVKEQHAAVFYKLGSETKWTDEQVDALGIQIEQDAIKNVAYLPVKCMIYLDVDSKDKSVMLGTMIITEN